MAVKAYTILKEFSPAEEITLLKKQFVIIFSRSCAFAYADHPRALFLFVFLQPFLPNIVQSEMTQHFVMFQFIVIRHFTYQVMIYVTVIGHRFHRSYDVALLSLYDDSATRAGLLSIILKYKMNEKHQNYHNYFNNISAEALRIVEQYNIYMVRKHVVLNVTLN
jgi:hypothetical protein